MVLGDFVWPCGSPCAGVAAWKRQRATRSEQQQLKSNLKAAEGSRLISMALKIKAEKEKNKSSSSPV